MSNRLRIFSIVLGAAALAGVTYGVARRGLQRRPVPPLANHALERSALGAAPVADARPLSAPDWALGGEPTRDSTPDPLDLAMNLSGIFDGQSAAGGALTARPNDHVPPPASPDDEQAASADDLGVAWLMQATQAEHSARGSDMAPEIENLAYSEAADDDDVDPNESAGDPDVHADFRGTRG